VFTNTHDPRYLIFNKFKATYDSNHDTFRIEFAILPSIFLALVANYAFTALEVSVASRHPPTHTTHTYTHTHTHLSSDAASLSLSPPLRSVAHSPI
jgi:hypothetical protein